ncbi:MAG: PAS domain-containing protein, partial [Pyrinomonadaceae bacterium]|nr:PAS domain-containing protein [Pyrinomonadaceae bacterium]
MNLQTPILIVDEDERKCTNVINILSNADYELFHAGDFEEAMNLTATRKPRLVIIAIRENTDFGVEVCRLIRTEKVYFGTVILQISPENLLTAEGSSHTPDCEPDAYLSEVCKPRELVSIVKTLLRFQSIEIQEKLNQEKLGKYIELVEVSEYFLWTLAPNGEIEYINQSWIDYTGLELEQIKDTGWNDALHPDDRERVFAEFRNFLESGEPYQMEMPLRGKNGEYRNFLTRAKPLKTDDGKIMCWLGVTLDIHEFKQIQIERFELNRRLQASLDELEILFDVLPVGVAIAKDNNCERITSNRYLSEILSTPKNSNISPSSEAVNEIMRWRFYRDGKELFADDLPIQRAAKEARRLEEFEFDVELPNKKITFMASAAPLFDENGAVSGSVGAFLDITERKKAELERERLLLKAETAHA